MDLLSSVCDRVRWALGLVLPVFARPGDYRSLGPAARWALHVVLVAALFVGLGALNRHELKHVLSDRTPDWLRYFWLPCLFLVAYVVGWLAWLLWQAAWPEKAVSDYPDIDQAWEEALAALHYEGIDPTEAPLFLVLGRPAGGEEALFAAAQLDLVVAGAPYHADAPLHVYGNRDAIFVTCADASLLGRQAVLFASGPLPGESESVDAHGQTQDPWATIRASGSRKQVQMILRKARDEGRELTAEEWRQVQLLGGGEGTATAHHEARRGQLLRDPTETEAYVARFKHLCRLVARDRRPYCPVNGILVLLPLAGTEGDDIANHVGGLCQHDLAAAREALQLHCPVLGLLSDLEQSPGFVEFLHRFPEEQRQRRVGQRFPLVPDLPAEEVGDVLTGLVRWVCRDLFALWVYKLFRVETPEKRDLAEALRGNVQLYELLRQMHEVDRPLARMVTRGLATPHNGLILFGGCYMAGTGADPAEQGFIAGVFRRLIDLQNFVSWTDEGLAEEAACDRWSQRAYAALVALAVVVVTALVVFFYYFYGT